MSKVRVSVTFVKEYELNPEYYPGSETDHERLMIDIEGVKSDPYLFIDDSDSVLVQGEILK